MSKKTMFRKAFPLALLSLSALALVGGFGTVIARAEDGDSPTVGQHLLKMTDLAGEEHTLPAWFDGTKYLLADYTRNIYVHNGFSSQSLNDVVSGTDRMPVYSSATGEFTDSIAISLYYNVITAYDFYSKENIGEDYFGLMGKNDDTPDNWLGNRNEIPLHVFAHFNAGEYRYNAACFSEGNTAYLIAGDGDASNTRYNMYHQAASLDVIAHEYQHGITRYLRDGLTYMGDSGAMDEAFADIFGMIISEEDMNSETFWTIGEGCTINGKPQRRIDYPLLSGDRNYRETVSSKHVCAMHRGGAHNDSCDNNYVHHNSTIISHAQFTAWEIAPESFSRTTIATLWFNTLKKLGKNATFNDFAIAIRGTALEMQLDEAGLNALDYSLYVNGFTKTVMHKVTFVDDEGEVLFYAAVPHGGKIEDVKPQTKDSLQYSYSFVSWDGDLDFILEDTTVTAVYEKTPKMYTVRFEQDDGSLIAEKAFPYGSAIEYPEAPEREGGKDYYYRFSGWRGTTDEVKGDMTVTAAYERVEIERSPLPLILGLSIGGAAFVAGVAIVCVLFQRRQRRG